MAHRDSRPQGKKALRDREDQILAVPTLRGTTLPRRRIVGDLSNTRARFSGPGPAPCGVILNERY